jgi:hypothetical protein
LAAGFTFATVPALALPRAGILRATLGWLAALRLADDTRLGFARLFDFAIPSRYLLDRDHVNGVQAQGRAPRVVPRNPTPLPPIRVA